MRIKQYLLVIMAMLISLPAFGLDIMPVSEVKAGMTGTGYSVFSGAMPEPFQARIIDVINKSRGGRPMIMAELSGANLEESGIIAGMSGSPVYIDGKLIGAVAYAWSWSKRPIAGITPIEDMLELWKDLDRDMRADSGETGNIELAYNPPGEEQGKLVPISTPLLIGGMDDSALSFLDKSLEKYGMMPIQGGGVYDGEDIPGMDDLAAGHVIACPLITGDFLAAAIGTVTAREGDKVLAFGHPFFNNGPVSIPMAGGSISLVMPVQTVSFKVGQAGKILGAVKRDHNPAIAGVIGEKADFFPMTVSVSDPQRDWNKTYSVEIAQIKELAPSLMMSVIGQAVQFVAGASNEVNVEYTFRGNLVDYDKPFEFSDVYYSEYGYFSNYTAQYVLELLNNGLRETKIKNMEVEITILHGRRTVQVVSYSLDKSKYNPGDTVKATVLLKDHMEKELYKTFEYELPADMPAGKYIFAVEGGGSIDGMPTKGMPVTFDQMFDILAEWIPQNTVTFRLTYPDVAIGVNGKEIQGLPPSMKDVMIKYPDQNMSAFERYDRKTYMTDSVAMGKASGPLLIMKEY